MFHVNTLALLLHSFNFTAELLPSSVTTWWSSYLFNSVLCHNHTSKYKLSVFCLFVRASETLHLTMAHMALCVLCNCMFLWTNMLSYPDEGRRSRCRATAEEDKERRNGGSHEFNDGNHDRFPTGKGSLASGGRDRDGKEERKTNNTAWRGKTANGGHEQRWKKTRDEVMPAVEDWREAEWRWKDGSSNSTRNWRSQENQMNIYDETTNNGHESQEF